MKEMAGMIWLRHRGVLQIRIKFFDFNYNLRKIIQSNNDVELINININVIKNSIDENENDIFGFEDREIQPFHHH